MVVQKASLVVIPASFSSSLYEKTDMAASAEEVAGVASPLFTILISTRFILHYGSLSIDTTNESLKNEIIQGILFSTSSNTKY